MSGNLPACWWKAIFLEINVLPNFVSTLNACRPVAWTPPPFLILPTFLLEPVAYLPDTPSGTRKPKSLQTESLSIVPSLVCLENLTCTRGSFAPSAQLFFFSYPNFLCQTELANYFLTNKLFKNQVFSTSYVLVGSVTPVCSNSLFDRKTCVQVRLATTWLWQFKGIWNISKTPSPEGSNCGF